MKKYRSLLYESLGEKRTWTGKAVSHIPEDWREQEALPPLSAPLSEPCEYHYTRVQKGPWLRNLKSGIQDYTKVPDVGILAYYLCT